MKRHVSTILTVITLGTTLGCDRVFGVEQGTLDPRPPEMPVAGKITTDTTWTTKGTWRLKDFVIVEDGVTLTIEAGTQIIADQEAGLFINRGAQIIAKGTAEAPIVFTSARASRDHGNWRGLYLCGRALINGAPSNNYVVTSAPEVLGLACGGADDKDSSGEMHYVRIEFAGDDTDVSKVSGLEMLGVGSGTSIDHIHVHDPKTDAFSMIGGTVSPKYILATSFGDEAFDWAYGWRGKLQFAAGVSLRNDGGIEGGDAPSSAMPMDTAPGGTGTNPSNPTIYNMTLVGTADDASSNVGVTLQDGIKGQYVNMLVADFGELGFRMEEDTTKNNAVMGTLNVTNSIFTNPLNFDAANLVGGMPEETWVLDVSRKNRTLPLGNHGIKSPLINNLDLSVTGEALSGAATPPSDGFFDPTATFIGACGETCPEFKGWTAFPVE